MFSENLDETIIIVVSSFLAMISFMAIALPYLNRTEKRERYQNIIEKKRKALFEQAKEKANKKKVDDTLSTKESLAFFFRIQEMFGGLGDGQPPLLSP